MSKAKILKFHGAYYGDINPEQVLQDATRASLSSAIVVGENDDGLFLAASMGDMADILLLLTLAKKRIMELIDNGESGKFR